MQVQQYHISTNSQNSQFLKKQSQNYSERQSQNYRQSQNIDQEVQQVQTKQIFKLQISEKEQQLIRKLLKRRSQIIYYKKLYYKLRSKNIGRRRHIQQLVLTQSGYKNDLKLIWQELREPLVNNNYISKQQQRIIFANINMIRDLCIQLEKQLSQAWQNYNFFQKFGTILTKKAPFFRIYIQYLNNYLNGEKYLNQLRAKNEKIKEVLQLFQKKNKQDTTSYLVKPVQRLQKYRILLLPIIQKTDPQHPDYSNLCQAHKKFCQTVQKVNEVKDKIQRNKRIQDLDKLYSNHEHPILNKNRQFLFQQNLLWICNQGKIPVLACFFNDLIIFINKHDNKIVLRLKWNQKSIIKDMQDGKKMKNIISISAADGSATVSTGQGNSLKQRNINRNLKQKIIQQITNLMINSRKKQQNQIQNVQVRALGTQQINSTSLSKHTLYILQVKIGQVRQNIYIRFNQMIQLSQNILHVYSNLKNKPLPSLQKKVFNHSSTTIQTRKFMIQQYLQTILNDQEILKSPQYIIKALNLKQKFYMLPKILAEKRRQSQANFQLTNQLNQISGQQILCATQVSLGRCLYNIQQKKNNNNIGQNATIQVKLLTGEIHCIKINEFMTVQDLCYRITKIIGLSVDRDFRLFHQIGKKQCRVLDHEQIIMKIFDFKQQKSQGFFSKVKQAIKGAIVPDTKPLLIFKKYYYLPHRNEDIQLRKDLVRVRLIAYQILAQIKQMKYLLNFEDYVQFCAFHLYLQNKGQIQYTGRHLNINSVIHKIVPEIIYKNQNISNQKWNQKIYSFLKKLNNQINLMINHNANKIKQLKKNAKIQYYTDKIVLCQRLIINKIRNNPLHNSNIFFIQPHQTTLNLMESKKIIVANQNHNMWLSIYFNGFSFLKPANKQSVLQIKYQSIIKKIVQPQSLVFYINQNQKQVQYKFKTWQSFQISQLIQYNKVQHQILKKIAKSQFRNSQLNKKTRVYLTQRSLKQ